MRISKYHSPRKESRKDFAREDGPDERQYTPDQLEFLKAMDAYKRDNRRPFPTCCEVLDVLRSLGYVKREPPPTPTPLE